MEAPSQAASSPPGYNEGMASAGPPTSTGQISPDGRWRWDGTQWVPTGQVATTRRPTRWIWWLIGGCAVLVLVAVIAGVLGLASLFTNFQRGGLSCLPSGFPAYPGATVTSENTYYGSGLPPGDTRECRMTLESADDVSTVTTWYSSHLNSGDWKASTDAASGTIRVQNNSKSSTVGNIELLGRGQHTEIRITLDS